ncbi:carbohydrate esterase family 4 protein [Desarmillaria tabescens]|uniref:chitin deacetylase n=1 Tax=Armillaria tabescens TaxID=1929756 RepID=A0AA39NMS3_ARMTA|nr:carbohydrate esterase family 4 protein [Desarmillaria tabescens]KAK0468364.1 carbohydrate esterase family 4 protein [Desarmillaria tabescens]
MLVSLFLAVNAAFASSLPRSGGLDHVEHKRLPDNWYHRRDHPVQNLFKRAPPGDGINYAQVGSPTWSSSFPTNTPDTNQLPQAWVDALNDAVAAGKIPNIPQSTNTPGTNPVYPNGMNPAGPEICSGTYQCRIPGDTWDAPTGTLGVGFDDGPQPATSNLATFLQAQNQSATHFMIGVNILNNANQFLAAYDIGGDIAVHTYTHPYMTTLSNLQIVAELGWTMEIIHNSTGGRVPRFWRPPYGDSDNRVRAIALEVFGLECIIWNQDTDDWSMATGGTTMQAISDNMNKWLTGPKTPGLIILEHELTNDTVQAFINAYPTMKSNGWNTTSVSRLVDNDSPYQNSDGTDDDSTVSVDGILVASTSSSTSSSSSTSDMSTTPSQAAAAASTTASASVSTTSNSAINLFSEGHALLGVATSVLFIVASAASFLL